MGPKVPREKKIFSIDEEWDSVCPMMGLSLGQRSNEEVVRGRSLGRGQGGFQMRAGEEEEEEEGEEPRVRPLRNPGFPTAWGQKKRMRGEKKSGGGREYGLTRAETSGENHMDPLLCHSQLD